MSGAANFLYCRTLANVLNPRVSALHLRSTTIVTRLTEHDNVIKSLLRGAPRLGLALGPHLALRVTTSNNHVQLKAK